MSNSAGWIRSAKRSNYRQAECWVASKHMGEAAGKALDVFLLAQFVLSE